MALNFPSTPNNNDRHTENGIEYYYDSTVGTWLLVVPSIAGNTLNSLNSSGNNFQTIVDAVGEGINNQWIEYLAFGNAYVPPPAVGRAYGYIF